jgi:hypothetical protein
MRNYSLLILSILAVLLLAACDSATSAAMTEVPTMLPTSLSSTDTPTPTAAPTHTPVSNSQFQSFPRANCCRRKTIEAGEYELPSWLVVPLTVNVGEGWSVMNEEAARLFLLAGKERNEFNDPSQVLVFMNASNADPQTVLTSIKDSSELTSQSEITETTIAGFSGWQFDATAKPNPANKGNLADSIPAGAQNLPAINKYFTPGFLWTTWTAEPRLRFVALNVGEEVLLLEIESPPTEFEAFASEAEQVLQTLTLRR